MTSSPCGSDLQACQCVSGLQPRTAAQVEALHREAVRRAWRWAGEPVPAHVIEVLLPGAARVLRRAS